MTETPLASFVLCSNGDPRAVRLSLEHHAGQTLGRSMEIILVVPWGTADAMTRAFASLPAALRIVEMPEGERRVNFLRAAGFRAARSECVLFGEDHAFHDPAWGETVLKKLREDYAGVGPMYRNANPGSAVSRAEFLHCFGHWAEPITAGPMERLPWHNSAYLKSAVLALPEPLEDLLGAESLLQQALIREGGRLWLETATPLRHVHVSMWYAEAAQVLHHARIFGTDRARRWSLSRKMLQLIATPLVPLVLLRKSLTNIRRCGWGGPALPTFFAICTSTVIQSLGEAWGYLTGCGNSLERVADFEMGRGAFLAAHEKHLLLPDVETEPVLDS